MSAEDRARIHLRSCLDELLSIHGKIGRVEPWRLLRDLESAKDHLRSLRDVLQESADDAEQEEAP